MNYIIENELSITGIVKDVRDNSILIYIETDDYPYGADCDVSLDVENTDSYTDVSVGDELLFTTMAILQKVIRCKSILYMQSH